MNIKTNLLEDFINFVKSTAKQNTYFKKYRFICCYYILVFIFSFTLIHK